MKEIASNKNERQGYQNEGCLSFVVMSISKPKFAGGKVMQIQKCTMVDVPKLALLNKQLIEDEKSDNTMNIRELESRMKGFLETDYSAYFFMEDRQIIGYALVRNTSSPVYLRQFLIDRDYRKHHYGTQAFQMLLRYLDIKEIDLEVLPWNESGLAFWKHCGFHETCIAMRYQE